MKYFVLAIGIIVCLASVIGAEEEEVTLKAAGDAYVNAKKDTYVDAEIPDINLGDDEILTVFADWADEMVGSTKTLIWFDMNDLPPEAHVIMVAHLILRLEGTENDIDTVEVFQAGEEWSEMDVTWNTRPAEDRSISVLARPPGPGVFGVDVTPFVQSWVELDEPNYGFYIDVPDNDNWVDIDFVSRENLVGVNPQLVVVFYNDVAEDKPSAAEFNVTSLGTDKVSINFTIPSSCPVLVKIYDATGSLAQTLVEGQSSAGNHQLTWSAQRAGSYFIKLEAGEFRATRKAVIVR